MPFAALDNAVRIAEGESKGEGLGGELHQDAKICSRIAGAHVNLKGSKACLQHYFQLADSLFKIIISRLSISRIIQLALWILK